MENLFKKKSLSEHNSRGRQNIPRCFLFDRIKAGRRRAAALSRDARMKNYTLYTDKRKRAIYLRL